MTYPLVMVIDDEIDVADFIANTIKDTKRYNVITAYSAKEGLKHLSNNKIFFGLGGNRIQLIVLDIKMPEMDGLQFLAKIRKEYSKNLGVLVLTAYEDKDKWRKSREGGVVAYIKKPFEVERLLKTIDDFFAGKIEWMVEETTWETLEKETKAT
jgi:CheY-like chemotaxis protein